MTHELRQCQSYYLKMHLKQMFNYYSCMNPTNYNNPQLCMNPKIIQTIQQSTNVLLYVFVSICFMKEYLLSSWTTFKHKIFFLMFYKILQFALCYFAVKFNMLLQFQIFSYVTILYLFILMFPYSK